MVAKLDVKQVAKMAELLGERVADGWVVLMVELMVGVMGVCWVGKLGVHLVESLVEN